jgi:diguanylate cyclase (GGDEF)-like protein
MDAASGALYGVDLEGRCTYANRACLRILGVEDLHDLLGADMQALFFAAGDGSPADCPLLEAMREAKNLHLPETLAKRQDGGRVLVERWSNLLHEGKRLVGLVVSLADVTLAKAARGALKRDHDALEMQVRDLSQHSKEMALFGQLAEMLQACASLEELCKIVAAFARELFPHACGALYLLEPLVQIMDPEVSWGDPGCPPLAAFRLQDCWSIRRGKPHYQERSQEDIFCAHIAQPPPAFSFCLPLNGQGGILGLLRLQAGATEELMSEPRQLVAVALAHQVALGLSNLKLKEILREEAIRDPTTGLFNRRFMQESLDHEVQRAQRTGTSVGIIAFDLDHFKDVNDTLGHAAGDSLLAVLANVAKGGLRAEDISCRQGGDEFLLILPDITESATLALAEGLRKKADQFITLQFPAMDGKVTISVGVAMFPQDAVTAKSLQEAADQALYRAKTLGRDRVVAASALAGAGPARRYQ